MFHFVGLLDQGFYRLPTVFDFAQALGCELAPVFTDRRRAVGTRRGHLRKVDATCAPHLSSASAAATGSAARALGQLSNSMGWPDSGRSILDDAVPADQQASLSQCAKGLEAHRCGDDVAPRKHPSKSRLPPANRVRCISAADTQDADTVTGN